MQNIYHVLCLCRYIILIKCYKTESYFIRDSCIIIENGGRIKYTIKISYTVPSDGFPCKYNMYFIIFSPKSCGRNHTVVG